MKKYYKYAHGKFCLKSIVCGVITDRRAYFAGKDGRPLPNFVIPKESGQEFVRNGKWKEIKNPFAPKKRLIKKEVPRGPYFLGLVAFFSGGYDLFVQEKKTLSLIGLSKEERGRRHSLV